jgi:hypothetical protein
MDQGLLDPGKPEPIQCVAAGKRFGQVQALVEVDHQRHVVAHRLPHRRHRREVVGEPLSPQPQFQRLEPALVPEQHGLLRHGRWRMQP